MKRTTIFRIFSLIAVFLLSSNTISETHDIITPITIKPTPLYHGVWGSIYHAEKRQCDDTPTITGDGSIINPRNASELRWLAISQEMLNCDFRQSLVGDTILYRGKIKYGDTVWIDSPYSEINGWWIVHDTKNKRYRGTIDFLQTKGDGTLYGNNSMWSGKFENIKIYSINDAELLGFNANT